MSGLRYRWILPLLLALATHPARAQTDVDALTATPEAGVEESNDLTDAEDQAEQRLEELKRQLADTKRRLDLAEEKEQLLLSMLNDISRELSERADELDRIQEQIAERELEVEGARAEIEEANRRIDENKKYLRKRLRSIYMFGRVSMIEVLFSSSSYSELVRRTRFHSALARSDASRIDQLERDLRVVEQRKADLDMDLGLLRELAVQARTTKEAIALQFEFRKSLLESVRGERGLLIAAYRQIETAQSELSAAMQTENTEEIAKLVPTVTFSSQKGRLVWPAAGPLERGYGKYRHPKTGTYIFHHGVAIQLEIGSDVRAVAAGKVVKAEWFPNYGQMLLIDHGERYHTLYAHNSKLLKKVGDRVSEGEVIAHSGDTASLTGPKLYFAIFHDGKAINPTQWLVGLPPQ